MKLNSSSCCKEEYGAFHVTKLGHTLPVDTIGSKYVVAEYFCRQISRDHPEFPLLPPDVVGGTSHSDSTQSQKRLAYNDAYKNSRPHDAGNCKRDLPGSMYTSIDEKEVEIIDPSIIPFGKLVIEIEDPGGGASSTSILQWFYEPDNKNLMNPLKRYAENFIPEGGIKSNCRLDATIAGEKGNMWSIGYCPRNSTTTIPYRQVLDGLKDAMEAANVYYSQVLPDVLDVIRKSTLKKEAHDVARERCPELASTPTLKHVISGDLTNAPHNDCDVKPGIATWIEREEGKSSGWYMILPNVTRGARDTDPVTNCKKNSGTSKKRKRRVYKTTARAC